MLEWGIWFCKNECYQLFLTVWQCSVINVISPAFLLQQHFTFQLIVAPSLCFGFHQPTCTFSCTRVTYSPAYSCIFSLLSVTLPVLSMAQLWGVWNWKQNKSLVCLWVSPAPWLEEQLIHVQLCVTLIRCRINQSQKSVLLEVSEMSEEKV